MDKNILVNRISKEKPIYSLLNESYDGWQKIHSFHCSKHNIDFNCTPKELFAKSSKKICHKCFEEIKQEKKKIELENKDKEFRLKLSEKFNNKISIIEGNYNGNRGKLKFKCSECSYEWISTPESILSNNGCRRCSSRETTKKRNYNTAYTKETLQEKIDSLYGKNIYIVQNDSKPFKILHTKCRNITTPNLSNLTTGKLKHCSKCANNIKKTTEKFKQEVFEKSNGEYEVIGEYNGKDNYIKMKHICKKCDYNEFNVTP